jgi:hypothetical protein
MKNLLKTLLQRAEVFNKFLLSGKTHHKVCVKKTVNPSSEEDKKSIQENQLKILTENFGKKINYVDIEIYATHNELEDIFGPECERFDPLCICCSAHLQWQKTNKITVTLERDKILSML